MGETRDAYTVFWENVKERDCVTLSCRWEDSMNLEEMGW